MVGQSLSCKHCTQVLFAVSQKGVPPPPSVLQLVLSRHRTQIIVDVLQYGVGGVHCIWVVHPRTHRPALLHARPASPQFVLVRHCTQAPFVEQ
jgi:hypothetical protein